MCNNCTENNNENIVGFIKFTNYPFDLATKGIFLQNIDDFINNGSPLIKDHDEGKIKFDNGETITYKELISLFNNEKKHCQSYISCFTALKCDDFESDYSLKHSTISKLKKYADNRDCVLFGSDLNKVFETFFQTTIEFHNKYFKKNSYENTSKIQEFGTMNQWKYRTMFSSCAWSCLYTTIDGKEALLNDKTNTELLSELKGYKKLETKNMISISNYANFVNYSDEININSLDKLKQCVIQNIDDPSILEKPLGLCLCSKGTKYSLENEYRLLITEFSDTDIEFPKAIKLLYPGETSNTTHTLISPLKFKIVKKESLKDIKLTDFKDSNLKITSLFN